MQFVRLEGKPLKGRELENLKAFLNRMDLCYDEGIEYTICLLDEEYQIIAAGSAEQNVLKCIAIAPEFQGQGLSATIVSALIQYEFEQGRTHLLLYTKPKNQEMFEDLSFYTVLKTKEVLFMENKRRGFSDFIEQLKRESPDAALLPDRKIGAIVANCNPFTLGHRYLIEEALKECEYVHMMVLADKRTFFDAEERFQMVKAGTGDLDRLILHQVSDFVISAATFPTYFIKEKARAEEANCRLDLELFARCIAPELHISKRFIGTEPECAVTNAYNNQMKEILPAFGIAVKEIPRREQENRAISASDVRKLLLDAKENREENLKKIKSLVPESTLDFLRQSWRTASMTENTAQREN